MTETERIRAVAKYYRELEEKVFCDSPAIADMFDGIADRHTLAETGQARCRTCGMPGWPCPDVHAALAVADALGVER